jgi:prepilin peptidase CpaA
MMPIWIFYFLLVELLVVAVLDIKTKKIKNAWSILNILLFVLFLFIYPEYYPFEGKTFLISGAFLLVGFILFLLKIMGAGDTKFLFSFFLVIPFYTQDDILSRLLIYTAICAFIFLLFNVTKNIKKLYLSLLTRDTKSLKECFGSKFAFAPVIFISWVWYGLEGGYFGF